MTKKLLLLLMTTLVITACSVEDKEEPVIIENKSEEVVETNKVNDEPDDTEKEETVEEEKEESSLGKRSNPVPLGETVQFPVHVSGDDGETHEGKGSLTLHSVERGSSVYDKLLEMNQFNEEAPDGYEWAFLELEFSLDELDSEDESYYVMFDFKAYGSDGSETPSKSAVVHDEFGWVELYAGGTNSGLESILLPIDDDEAKIKVSDWDINIFMETK